MFDVTPAQFYAIGLSLWAAVWIVFELITAPEGDVDEDGYGPVHADMDGDAGVGL